MDWENELFGSGVTVRFTPRYTYMGRFLKPGVLPHYGESIEVVPLWQMDETDKYPGEWALGRKDYSDIFGLAWIASGDVSITSASKAATD